MLLWWLFWVWVWVWWFGRLLWYVSRSRLYIVFLRENILCRRCWLRFCWLLWLLILSVWRSWVYLGCCWNRSLSSWCNVFVVDLMNGWICWRLFWFVCLIMVIMFVFMLWGSVIWYCCVLCMLMCFVLVVCCWWMCVCFCIWVMLIRLWRYCGGYWRSCLSVLR